jgi:hypothetical protein
MEAIPFSKSSVHTRTTRPHVPEATFFIVTAVKTSNLNTVFFPLLHGVQTASEAGPTSYPKGTGDILPWGKEAGEETDLSSALLTLTLSVRRSFVTWCVAFKTGSVLDDWIY